MLWLCMYGGEVALECIFWGHLWNSNTIPHLLKEYQNGTPTQKVFIAHGKVAYVLYNPK